MVGVQVHSLHSTSFINKSQNSFYMILWILMLIDVHTLFVLIFHEFLSLPYVFTGGSLLILKGLIFYLMGRDLLSLLDIIVGFIMLFLMFTTLWSFLWAILFFYLGYKIVISATAL